MNAIKNTFAWRRIGRTIGVVSASVLVLGALARNACAEHGSGASGGLGGIGTSDLAGVGGVYVDDGYSYPFRASTPGESFARGRADVIRAQGEFNRLTSEAAINAQQARSGAIANAKDGVDAYFRIREMNRDYRRAERGPRPTAEDFQRYSSAGRPMPLSPSDLDTLTGKIRWPVLLRDVHFAPLRTQLEGLLDQWAVSRNLGQGGSFGTHEHLAVRQAIAQMEDQLRVAVRNLHPQDYAASQRFLQSLEYQVLHQPGSAGALADVR